ncbi:MAG: NAD(P)H-dependent oxidoreductase subunit E [Deltaproteobacteria bacterium]|nr:NAD(P)H-dependent oxidoreductase subunit E [Myxococcales bacterium]MDP3220067.1 NAD(P)H-dependent oxidoreductase subunit E [Deltaproteobacteria bacterium]
MSHNLIQLRRNRGDLRVGDTALQRLKEVMHERRVITAGDIVDVARASGQPEAAVYGVATYYGDLGTAPRGRLRVKICKGTACHAACGDASVGWMEDALGLRLGETRADGEVSLEAVYCLGFCNAGPSVEVEGRVYGELTPARARALADDLAHGGGVDEADGALVPRFEARGGPAIVLERLSLDIDATQLDVARAHGAFEGLSRALGALTPEQVLAEVELAQLRGRGGAGFATAQKWRFAAANARGGEAYVVCNADEGDPGSYIDKYLMERDPYAVLEGAALAGYAIGAARGFVYVRSEYPRSAPALRRAVLEARAAGLLGEDILGSGFSFDIEVVEGAGSYVCGEETALLRSLEGLRGMVTARPPYPADKGLFERPTVVNNVETLVNVGWIVRHGGEAYARLGVGRSRGTKAVSLNERFATPGIYEVPLGVPLRSVLEGLGGGMKTGRPIKAVQVGGPLGGILPEALLDAPLGFEELAAVGALLGHGGIVAWDDAVDPRDIAIHLFEFCDAESCGKCFPCRIGGRRGLELARRLKQPRSAAEVSADVALLGELCETLQLGSLCAHGGAIPDPIRSLLTHFAAEMTSGVSP